MVPSIARFSNCVSFNRGVNAHLNFGISYLSKRKTNYENGYENKWVDAAGSLKAELPRIHKTSQVPQLSAILC